MEKEKPYQPSEEEVQKAEGMMDDDQREWSEIRERILTFGLRAFKRDDYSGLDKKGEKGLKGVLESIEMDDKELQEKIDIFATARIFLGRKKQETLRLLKEKQEEK